jgi:Secretion system C-terminal sorting domain
MKNLLLIIAIAFFAQTTLFAQQTYVPDDNFEQALIDLGYDSGPLNDSVPTKNIDTVRDLNLYSKDISDLTGIQSFKALETLNCSRNELTTLDLSQNTLLVGLSCQDNKLESIDLSNNTSLTILSCGSNQLTSLDLSKNSELINLDCSWNELITLDVNGASALQKLECVRNNLTGLDLSENSNLKTLFCQYNKLEHLDLNNNELITWLYCHDNNLASFSIRNGRNKLLNVEYAEMPGFNISGNPDLSCIQVDDSSAGYEFWVKDKTAHYSEDCGYTGVEGFPELDGDFSIFPNPATTSFSASFEFKEPQDISISLIDISGKKLFERKLNDVLVVYEQIDVSRLPAGVYFLNVVAAGQTTTRKVIVE